MVLVVVIIDIVDTGRLRGSRRVELEGGRGSPQRHPDDDKNDGDRS